MSPEEDRGLTHRIALNFDPQIGVTKPNVVNDCRPIHGDVLLAANGSILVYLEVPGFGQ
jgi:hypothetical protein